MGCGSGAKDTRMVQSPRGKMPDGEEDKGKVQEVAAEVAAEVDPEKSPADNLLRGASFVREGNLTNRDPPLLGLSLPASGSVEVLSMQYVIKYSSKGRCFEVTHQHDVCIVSTMSWTTRSNASEYPRELTI